MFHRNLRNETEARHQDVLPSARKTAASSVLVPFLSKYLVLFATKLQNKIDNLKISPRKRHCFKMKQEYYRKYIWAVYRLYVIGIQVVYDTYTRCI